MTERFEDVLDAALAAIKTEPITAVLARYPYQAESLAPLLHVAEKVEGWQTAVPLTPKANWQTADRAYFLDQLEQLPATAVSLSPLLRLKGWLSQKRPALRNQFVQKEHKPMNALFARAIATALVIFGLGGGTVALANNSLPETPLYPVKLMLEETRMAMADNPVEQANLQMSLAQVRLQEMTQLAQAGDSVNDPLIAQLETHLQTAFQQAAQAGDTDLIGLLQRMQTMLQTEQQTMAQLGEPAQAMFGNVNQILNQYQEQVQAGLDDPPLFRWRHAQDETWEPAGKGQQNGQERQTDDNGQNGPGLCTDDCEPAGDENKFGQDPENGQNGPGSQSVPGTNNGSNNGHGPISPADNGQYGPDNGLGNTCLANCDPLGNQNHHGQNDTVSGSNGNGDGSCENDCTPAGDGLQPNPDSGNGNGHGNGG